MTLLKINTLSCAYIYICSPSNDSILFPFVDSAFSLSHIPGNVLIDDTPTLYGYVKKALPHKKSPATEKIAGDII